MVIMKDRVISIDYTLTDTENQHLDTTADAEPFSYLHGHANIIPGLEQALEGKTPGDRIHITVPAAEAYGERDEELIIQIPLENFQDAEEVEPGMQFEAHTPAGSRVLTVAGVAGDIVTVDGNHPLAGLDLIFDVTVTDVREASAEELACGHVHAPHACGCGGGCEDCADCGA
ncbi:MAG: peptidylprolyl isomerase [Spirochaetaceae bacterium]|jgi:FKBP-type peptidyl-prolyl cis-trans isomerase SlyD|nr:peptidylprolyl isomerase [Spirochaetaceae bacterium]